MSEPKPVPTKWSIPQLNEVHGRWLADQIEQLVDQFHPDLAEAAIQCLFCEELPTNRGKRVLGKAKVMSEKERLLTGIDLLIDLDKTAWMLASERQRIALLDHELCHFLVKRDAEGHEIRDDQDRLMYSSTPHDIEEFNAIIRRHGAWKSDLLHALDAIAEGEANGQMKLALQERATG